LKPTQKKLEGHEAQLKAFV